ncbi:hypothetical protein SASPL_116310 [Salvia splendens]|uniref:Response regulatory domain-containing protein n=1 Tax=Salvia splendens TaxID=180675 RepID=A0A8X8XTK0_SALSN|nr:hypothetical protein SASPL_116310 [Salvia splendens]
MVSERDEEEKQLFHVLAVDDSNIDRKLLERLLTFSSYQDIICGAEVSKVNLIMTDYSMPGISGYDLLKRIKDSSWKDVPVVVMSSENVPSRINMCLEGGAEEFLLKPVKLSDVEKIHSNLISSTNYSPCEENAIAEIEKSNNARREGSEIDKNCSNGNKRKAIKNISTDVGD